MSSQMRDKMLKQIGLCVAIVMAGAGVGTMRAAVVYDSAGFELPRFQAAPLVGTNALAGQDPAPPVGQGPWQQDAGTSSAVVQTNSVKSGLQSVYVQRLSGATGDTRWWVPVAVTPTVSDPAVDLSFDMDVNISAT